MPRVSEATKTRVNRAGKELVRYRDLGRQLKPLDWPPDDVARFIYAFDCVDAFRARHAAPLRRTNANLRWYVRPHGDVIVTQRLKKLSTVIDKLDRHPSMKLANMEDIGGVRAVLRDQAAVDDVARRLRKNWQIKRYRDYVRSPKDSGYRAVHIVAIKDGVFIEVQLRTYLQDVWANQVEHDSRHLRTDFKSGRGAAEVHRYYVAVSQLFAAREAGQDAPEALLTELRLSYAAARPFLAPVDDTP